MPTPAETLESCLRLLNSPHILTEEKPAWVQWMARHMDCLPLAEARLQLRISERTREALEAWAAPQRMSRRHKRAAGWVDEPSQFNTRKEYTTA